MEDVLDVYTRPYDPQHPQVRFDETSVQLTQDSRPPLPPRPAQDERPGLPAREDYEYERHGTANVFLWCEPLAGQRHVSVTAHRTKVDFAYAIRELVDEHYPDVEQIVLVLDNLNTHSPASLYETFPPEEAKRLTDRLEIHYTPKHGSWLNMAEIELSVLGRQCLADRIPGMLPLQRATTAWETRRNAARRTIDWRFTTANARIKLKHLYPVVTDDALPLAANDS